MKAFLPGFDGGFQVDRPEMGRSGQDHVVDLGNLQQLLVGVEAGEAAVPGDIDAQLAEFAAGAVQPVLEQVGQGNDLDVRVLDFCPFGDVFGVVSLARDRSLSWPPRARRVSPRFLARRSRSSRS